MNRLLVRKDGINDELPKLTELELLAFVMLMVIVLFVWVFGMWWLCSWAGEMAAAGVSIAKVVAVEATGLVALGCVVERFCDFKIIKKTH